MTPPKAAAGQSILPFDSLDALKTQLAGSGKPSSVSQGSAHVWRTPPHHPSGVHLDHKGPPKAKPHTGGAAGPASGSAAAHHTKAAAAAAKQMFSGGAAAKAGKPPVTPARPPFVQVHQNTTPQAPGRSLNNDGVPPTPHGSPVAP